MMVVIETPRFCRNKYAWDPDSKAYLLKKVLPAGMAFPYDFGFVPRTEADDGDPIDVLVLMDQPAFPGCRVKCRLIGVIEGEQREKGKKKVRNDRLVAVAELNHSYAKIKHLKDLGPEFLDELEHFFVAYHELDEAKFEVIGAGGPKEAHRRLKASAK